MRNLENFQVENKHAKIVFQEPVNIYGADIEKEIILKKKMVEVHPDKDIEVGKGFNKKAIITLKNIFNDEDKALPKKMLRTKAMRFVATYPHLEFISYNYEKNDLVFKAEHF